jgi:hypothetical protein
VSASAHRTRQLPRRRRMYLHQIDGALRADTVANFREVALTRGGAAHLQRKARMSPSQYSPVGKPVPFHCRLWRRSSSTPACWRRRSQAPACTTCCCSSCPSAGTILNARQCITHVRACVRACVRALDRMQTVAVVALLVGLYDAVATFVGAKHGRACSGDRGHFRTSTLGAGSGRRERPPLTRIVLKAPAGARVTRFQKCVDLPPAHCS